MNEQLFVWRDLRQSLVAGTLVLSVLSLPGLAIAGAQASAEDYSAAIAVDIKVQVVDTELQPLPGAVVEVLDAGSDPAEPKRIAHAAADAEGRAQFEELPPGRYTVRSNLTGFLDTEVGPLPLTAEDLRSTQVPELILVLNAVKVD